MAVLVVDYYTNGHSFLQVKQTATLILENHALLECLECELRLRQPFSSFFKVWLRTGEERLNE